MREFVVTFAILLTALALFAGEVDFDEVYDFTQVGQIPEMIDTGVPCYPDSAYKERVEGVVLVDVIIDESGKVISAEVAEAMPVGVFEDVALEAALKCTFKPIIHDDKPVKVKYRVPFVFGRDQYDLIRCSKVKKR